MVIALAGLRNYINTSMVPMVTCVYNTLLVLHSGRTKIGCCHNDITWGAKTGGML